MLSCSPGAEGTGAYLGCGMSPHLGAASDVQRVIELFVHLGSSGTQQRQGAASPQPWTRVFSIAAPAAECKETTTYTVPRCSPRGWRSRSGSAGPAAGPAASAGAALRYAAAAPAAPQPGTRLQKAAGTARAHAGSKKGNRGQTGSDPRARRGRRDPNPARGVGGALRLRPSHALRLRAAPRPP